MALTLDALLADEAKMAEITESWFCDLWENHKPKNPEEARKIALFALLLVGGESGRAQAYVRDMVQAGMLQKQDVMWLFRVSKRMAVQDIDGLRTADGALFTPEEVFELARSVTRRDMHFEQMVKHFVRGSRHSIENVPQDLLRKWYEDLDIGSDGKTGSLLMLHLYKEDPAMFTPREVIRKLDSLAQRDPYSHGIHRLLSLLAWMVSEDPRWKRRPWKYFIQGFVSSIEHMLRGQNEFGAEGLVGDILGDPEIPRPTKRVIVRKLKELVSDMEKSVKNSYKRIKKSLNTDF